MDVPLIDLITLPGTPQLRGQDVGSRYHQGSLKVGLTGDRDIAVLRNTEDFPALDVALMPCNLPALVHRPVTQVVDVPPVASPTIPGTPQLRE